MRLSVLSKEITVFQACASDRCCLRKLECFKHALVVGVVTPRQAPVCCSRALAPVRKCAYFLFFSVLPHCCGLSSCALSACTLVDVVTSWLKFDEKKSSTFNMDQQG